jgi:predicted DNA-binding protein
MVKYRAQILLEAEQHAILSELAEQRKESISGVVREIVGEYIVRMEEDELKQRELNAVQGLQRLRHGLQQDHGILSEDWLDESRAERLQDLVNPEGEVE